MSDAPNPYEPSKPAPPVYPGHTPGQGDATGGIIPYKNGPALLAYYLGILSLLCCFFGIPLGIVPLVLGIMGLRKRARQPEVKGSIHAWIGIICGVISILGAIMFAIAIIGAIVQSRQAIPR